MERFILMAQTQSVLFIYMLVGYVCTKFKLTESVARKSINNLLIYVALPCMIFESFNIQITRETLSSGLQAIAIAAAWAVVALLVGNLAYRRIPKDERDIMKYGTLVSNSGFAGLPVIESVYGAPGLFLASLYIIPTRILMWSAGISIFTDTPLKQRIKNVALNPGLIAVYLGFIRMILQPAFPAPIEKSIGALGSMTTPLSMILIGMILSEIDIKTVLNKRAFILAGVRQIALPVSLLILLKFLHIDDMTTQVAVILTGMPIGSTTAVLADKYGANVVFGSKCVFISTLTSLITIPLLSLLF